jgi:hypothetical protein
MLKICCSVAATEIVLGVHQFEVRERAAGDRWMEMENGSV